ncbi:MAG: mechanosensitive ion channel family protein [Ignavibacteriae bacterium]|nr:mechanosensitive ion channel family protein [Ignavibacteriota bacterium]
MTGLDQLLLGNSIQTWTIGLGIAVVCFIGLKVIQRIIVRRLADLASRTETDIDDLVVAILQQTNFFFLLVLSIEAGTLALTLSPAATDVLQRILVLALLVQGALWANGAISYLLRRSVSRRMEEDAASATTLSAIGFVSKVVLWSLVLLLALDNLGVNITGLVAGLGIGGIAVALAIQNILGDLFASLSIVLDKPFIIGDFIIVDQHLGSVEHIGLKTTRIRSLSGEQIVFSNADLLNSRIRNYKRMFERRVVFTIGVTYQTSHKQLTAISTLLREIIESQPLARFDRAHFREYGDSALIYEAVYYVKSPEYNTYMDIQQTINLEIFRRFSEERIDFAYPTRTLHLHTESAYPAAPGDRTAGTHTTVSSRHEKN